MPQTKQSSEDPRLRSREANTPGTDGRGGLAASGDRRGRATPTEGEIGGAARAIGSGREGIRRWAGSTIEGASAGGVSGYGPGAGGVGSGIGSASGGDGAGRFAVGPVEGAGARRSP